MALQGPILIVADLPAEGLAQAFANAGAFPVIEASWSEAQAALAEIKPSAIVAREPEPVDMKPAMAVARQIVKTVPFLPMIVRLREEAASALPDVLTVAKNVAVERLVARVGAMLRLRVLHVTVLGRACMLKVERDIVAEIPVGDPLDDATVLLIGRGRHHPTLSVAVGERVGVIGALSVETAARCLTARDIDGIVIGDGLPMGSVDALLEVLAEDWRFRDLPIAVLGRGGDAGEFPNFVRAHDPMVLLGYALPLIRMRAFEVALKRLLAAIECKGMLDPQTGLLNAGAFGRELGRAIEDAGQRGVGLSLARFSFEEKVDRRTSMDAARLASRLVRNVDFACRQDDGSILFAFSDTDLRSAHVVARRLASVLKHTMLQPDRERPQLSPTVTLATLKPADTMLTLLARVTPRPVADAGTYV